MEYLELIKQLKAVGLSETSIFIIGVLVYFFTKHKECEKDRDKLRGELEDHKKKLEKQDEKIEALLEVKEDLLSLKTCKCVNKNEG